MKAIQVAGDELRWAEFERPVCGPGEVRIQVAASAINRADLLQRGGAYPPPPGASPIMGLECSGVVTELGEGVASVALGDEVCALLAGGGYAEEAVVPAGQVLPVPKGVDCVDAAALPEVFATAYLNLYMEAALAPAERVIVHAGASGVGTAAVQMLRYTNNPCFVTVGNQDKLAQCVELGASGGAIRHEGSFLPGVQDWLEASGAAGVDVILDPVGGQYLMDNLTALGLGGRLVLIGLMSGAVAEADLSLLMRKRIRVIGSTLRARPIGEKALVMDGLRRDVWPRIEAGEITPIIEAKFPIEQTADAHALMAGNDTVGKILLTV